MVKLTDSTRKFIFSEIYKYAEQLGITVETFPQILLSRKEVMNHEKTIGKTTTARYYGFCQRRQTLIFINVKHSPNRKKLRDTIIHELVHYRFPYLGHGSRFENKIKQVYRGVKFKPHKPKKEIVSAFAISSSSSSS